MTNYQDAWPIYQSLGWDGTLPLPPGKKGPPPTGYTGRAGVDPTAQQCARFGRDHRYRDTTQMALRMPDVVMGLDVDLYDGRTGGRTTSEGERRFGVLPDGPWSSARDDGSGIRFFLVPANTSLVSELKFAALGLGHVEIIRRVHRYAVVWPSTHPGTGTSYSWRDTNGMDQPPAVDDLPRLPDGWLAGLNPAQFKAPAPAMRPGNQPALAHARLNGVLRFVTSAQEGTRNSALSWAARRAFELVRDGEVAGATAEDMLRNAAAVIHLSDREALATITSARKWVLGG